MALNNIGKVYDDLSEPQKALDHFNQALPLARAVGDRIVEGSTLNNIGKAYSALGERQKALHYFDQALLLARAAGDRPGEAVTLVNMAHMERELGNLTKALTYTEATLPIVESLRTKIGSYELRSSFFATVQIYYEFYIDLLMRLHKQQPAAGYDAAALRASEGGRVLYSNFWPSREQIFGGALPRSWSNLNATRSNNSTPQRSGNYNS